MRDTYVRHVSPFEYEKNGPVGDWRRTNVHGTVTDDDFWSDWQKKVSSIRVFSCKCQQ